ncbi:hypothetical protein [Streptomyces sp. NPDC002520]
MRAQEITFLKLVQGDKQFQVPLYQRTYSWGREHSDAICEVLDWFVGVAALDLAQRD